MSEDVFCFVARLWHQLGQNGGIHRVVTTMCIPPFILEQVVSFIYQNFFLKKYFIGANHYHGIRFPKTFSREKNPTYSGTLSHDDDAFFKIAHFSVDFPLSF